MKRLLIFASVLGVGLTTSMGMKVAMCAKAQAQTRTFGNGGRFDDSRIINYVNNTTADQVLFSDTIKLGRFSVDKRYNFTSDFTASVPLLSTPAITFKIKIGDAPAMTFISNAGLVVGTTQSPMTMNGYFQRRLDGTVGINFRLNLPPTGLLGITLTPTSVNEIGSVTPTMTGDVPIVISVAFSNSAGTTVLTRLSLARSDF